jgi:hypothetical protein
MKTLIRYWQAMLDHPIVRLELQRIRRTRWWPGRRFFMFYPALLGAALGYGVMLALSDSLYVQLGLFASSLPVVCLLGTFASLLAFTLPWIAPALTAVSIARERELGTLDLLRVTLLGERSVVLGKLVACLARLWPGMLTLALLAPLQLMWGGGISAGAMQLPGLLTDSVSDLGWLLRWLFLVGLVGLLRPWGHLALHAAAGLFVSVLSRSVAIAIPVSYGALIALRVALWLLSSMAGVALTIPLSTAAEMTETAMNARLIIPSLTALGGVVAEFGGAALLVWGTVWWMKRL